MKSQGRVRHLFFIRHGQYDLESDEKGLTALGKEQSRLLALRLKAMMGQVLQENPKRAIEIKFAGVWSSDVLRARQTAEIISEHLGPSVPLFPPDPVLAEGQPAVPCPHKKPGEVRASTLWEESARVEYAFRRYIHRDVDHKKIADEERRKERKRAKAKAKEQEASPAGEAPQAKLSSEPAAPSQSGASVAPSEPEHVFEIIVCHCNVIRYFVMRGLQLPPEAWLRLGGYNTGITEVLVRPTGSVSLVRFGDTGHLPVDKTTFH